MRRLSIIIVPVFLLVMLAAGTAYAQDSQTVIRGDIPFNFIVADKTLPEGTYTVKVVSPTLTKIQDIEKRNVVVFQTIGLENGKQVKPMLVFRRYGDQYYLAQIWNGSTDGTAVPRTKKEMQVAKNLSAPELIYVAAK